MKKISIAFTLAMLLSAAAHAEYRKYDEWDKNYTVQGLLGAVKFEDLKIKDESGSGDPKTIDISTLPQLGGAWSTLPIGNRLQYGLETSFLLGFRFDKVSYLSAGGSGLHVEIETSMWMFDFAGGAYANLFLDKNRKIRVYAGGGPLMMFASYRSEREETGTGTEETYDNNESAFGLGVYGRTGIEFRVQERGTFGIGARATWSDVDLSGVGGSSDLTGTALFATFTAGF